ncbi:MAG: extracellular solute-binding protein [Treponema sp.]|nr:extracellular solute-binding protein [Treponema sp.]
MSKLRIVVLISVVTILVGGIIGFIMFTRNVDILPVSRAQSDAAHALLRNSLSSPRLTYVDFLNAANPAPGPRRDITVPASTTIAGGESLVYQVEVPYAGFYYFSLAYNALSNSFTDISLAIEVNGITPYLEAHAIILPVFWEDESKQYPIDKFGDESPPIRRRVPGPHRVHLFDTSYTSDLPLNFYLHEGLNTIEFFNNTAQLLWLGDLAAYSYREPEPYHASMGSGAVADFLNINAVYYTKKNSAHVSNSSSSSPHIMPYDPIHRRVNALTTSRAGDEIFYDINVPQSGYYALSLQYRTGLQDFAFFTSLRINGEFPFAQAASYPLAPTAGNRWSNYTLSDDEGSPYLIYLSQGNHQLSLRTERAPIATHIRSLRLLIDHINQFSIEIRKITGTVIDRNRTWRLTSYIPEISDYLDAYDIILRDLIIDLSRHSPRGENSSVIMPLVQAVSYLERLRERPDELPLYIRMLNGQDASVLQQAGVALDALHGNSLNLSAIYLGRAEDLPRENAPFMTVFTDGVRKLWNTYFSDRFRTRNHEDALNIWYASSYVQVDLLQRFIDTRFTPQTGIRVNLSVMPDVNRLIMARAAGTNPDIAMGVPSWMPFELALRKALYDLTEFDDFWSYMGNVVPGALTSYILNEGVYAVPETISFNATVYREDILGQLNIPPPNTWTDVAQMMAELQRFDMSFYMPIAAGTGYKWFYQTSPLIYQNEGLLYRPDGLGTAINEANAVNGISFLGDLFTTYALAAQVPSFFNSFRLGQTPVGIIDAGTYLLLTLGAPELMGQWNIIPYVGTEQEDGSISRWFIANGSASVVFENTTQPDNAWTFLKWFLSEETQTDFAFSLFSSFRIFYLPSNINALGNIPIDDNHKQTILESVAWLRDAPRSPGQYLLERGLSDIWNTIVFDGTPVRVAIDRQVIEIQREFRRKMTEFGYLNSQGEQVVPYVVREIDWIIDQIDNARLPQPIPQAGRP